MLEIKRREMAVKPLLDFIPFATPEYTSPLHLSPLTKQLDRIKAGKALRLLCSTPPRHGKTETLLHFLVQYLITHQKSRVAYISYEGAIAQNKSIQAKRIATRTGLLVGEKDTQSIWQNKAGGEFHAVGAGGPITGYGYNVIVVDDAIKNAQSAASLLQRERLWDWFHSVVMTRLEPNGSVVVNMTRWDVDDLFARLQRQGGWEVINLPAIKDGKALWAERFSIAELEEIKKRSDYYFEAMYQGNPRPRGNQIFSHNAITYNPLTLKLTDLQEIVIGVDFAYGHNPLSDYSVAIVMGKGFDGNCYILEMFRKQLQANEFASVLKFLLDRYPSARMSAFASGTEKGIIDLMNSQGLRIQYVPAVASKFIRSQNVASAWNAGQIYIPDAEKNEWVQIFLDEIFSFTGQNDYHDDIVDALASAYHCLASQRIKMGWL